MNNDLSATHIYQSFCFHNQVKSHFYTGNVFLSYRKDMTPDELIELGYEILEEDEFMPGLTSKIESLLGKGNFIYDYWEFGPDCFSLYWWIRKEVYHEKLTLVREWAEYEGISEWMEINEK
ncbi:hypothetical protein [Imperialibacter roseus]|uniref:Uncharacterized protein n=1 Tax=Imperialibacter roseus TaxID=1324217 RepID=A0ABZ0IP63_9BACT|nr:hypothetical protein [Imperialibacter roseus]WOK06264.1 hypothetical protein RT717_24625 [Imperialibacter roseus]|tara:strand:+ start:30013 stop:30375 length:363 start_codon:yes stop_codon:yes gene_type:complete